MRNLLSAYFGPHKKSVTLIVILLIIQVILQILIINLIKPIISNGINNVDVETIKVYGVAMIIMIVFYCSTTAFVTRMAARISAESASQIRRDMFRKVLSFKRPRDSGANISGLLNRLVTDVNCIQDFITEYLCTGLYVILLAIGVTIITSTMNMSLCISLTFSFILMIVVTVYLGRSELKVRSRLQRLFDRIIHLFGEILVGARTSRSFDTEKEQFETFSEYDKEYSDSMTRATIRVSRFSSFSTLVLMVSIILIYSAMVINFEDLKVSSSDLIVFIQYMVLFISCVSICPFIVTTTPQLRTSFSRISKVMNGQSEPSGDDLPDSYEGPLVQCSNGLIMEEGEEMSLVGRTGAGKSETIRRLLRLDDVKPGEISFKGVDITGLDPKLLRGSIAYAGSMAPAFRGSVRDNIKVWRDISDGRLNEVMKASKVDFGPDMILDKFGSNISAGQVQKISIARALASDADLYIFDDCFTELDPKTENEIVSNIRGMLKGKTVLFSSHQFRISPGSDGIAVMEDGKVIDIGRHEELLDRCDIYRRMYFAGGGFDV
ncbi:MAG: ABC transporter ATP-binding protein [Candidatus Methanomethylophilaceae archaeon]|nr:ABC transporter ATP-binding protein [Candidatus Methanomethylophilaceae archaeon]